MFNKSLLTRLISITGSSLILFIVGCHGKFSHHCFPSSPEDKAEMIVKKITSELELNEQQQVKLNEIKDEFLAKKNERQKDHKHMFDTILSEIKSEKIDQEKLKTLADSRLKTMKEMTPFVVSKLAEFHSILTPEQRVKLADKMQEFHNKLQ